MARGSIDYAEGVEGLVQAFHTAGARQVLVSLRKVCDHAAREFMSAFYDAWLAQSRSDPVAALQAVQHHLAGCRMCWSCHWGQQSGSQPRKPRQLGAMAVGGRVEQHGRRPCPSCLAQCLLCGRPGNAVSTP
jgi:hypothetical protein